MDTALNCIISHELNVSFHHFVLLKSWYHKQCLFLLQHLAMDLGEVPDKQRNQETTETIRRQREPMDEASLATTLQHIVGQLDVLTQVWNGSVEPCGNKS